MSLGRIAGHKLPRDHLGLIFKVEGNAVKTTDQVAGLERVGRIGGDGCIGDGGIGDGLNRLFLSPNRVVEIPNSQEGLDRDPRTPEQAIPLDLARGL